MSCDFLFSPWAYEITSSRLNDHDLQSKINILSPNLKKIFKLRHLANLKINSTDRRVFKGKCSKCGFMMRFRLNEDEENGIIEKENISFKINGVERIGF